MIFLLHTYYPPGEELLDLDLKKTIWTHSGYWDSTWSSTFPCPSRYLIPNIGKDIGGKLFGIKALIEQSCNEEFVCFLHDKRSPQVINGSRWNKELWSIADKDQIDKALSIFNKDPSIGIVAKKNSIIDPDSTGENYSYATNKRLIFEEAQRYNILPDNKAFVAGTMFVARLKPYLDFFKHNNPLLISSSFEIGNVLDLKHGTYTHSWERLLSWVLTSKGYKIASI